MLNRKLFFQRPTEKIVQNRTAILRGKSYEYRLIQSSAARTLRFKISLDRGLEVTVPKRFNTSHLDEIVREHEAWILRQLDKLESRKKLRDEKSLTHGATITVLGTHFTVKILAVSGRKPSVKRVQQLVFAEETASVQGYELHVTCDGTIHHAKKTLEKYLRTTAEKFFYRRTEELAGQMGVSFQKITIRGQKTRWGSCTREKNLNFNWRLILLPLEVAESVIIHELAHTVHMNHSRAFYSLVLSHCPEYRRLQKHLRNPQFPL